jgi:FkbM family methyltransferase
MKHSRARPWWRTPLLCLCSCLATALLLPLQPAPPCAAAGPAAQQQQQQQQQQHQQQQQPLLQASALCPRTDWAAAPAAQPEVWAQARAYSEQAPLAFHLALPPPEASFVSQAMASSGMWAPVKTCIFLHVLASPRVRQAARLVVDAGANLGYFSQLALGLGFEVAAFEPQARAQPYLAATAARNGNGARFHLHACALGSVRGRARMEASEQWETARPASVAPLQAALLGAAALPPPAGQGAAGAASVPMVLLSDVLRVGVPIALLKVNVEGTERGVLAGVSRALLRGVRNVLVEADAAETRAHLRARLARAGFQCRQLQERYFEQNSTGHSVGGFQDTRMPRASLGQVLMGFLTACADNGSEDYWFSREDYPWLCQTVGCDGGEAELQEAEEGMAGG